MSSVPLAPGDRCPELQAQPVFGLPVTLPGRGPAALVFVRPLSSPLGRLALQELQAAWPALDRAGDRKSVV